MSEPDEILAAAAACLAVQDLAGRRLLVSAGPTREPLDAVRYVGNRSSGRMGYALAAEAQARGAEVVLVSGPSALPVPFGVERVSVSTAAEMEKEIGARAPMQDAIVMAAAVADFRPRTPRKAKVKKEDVGDRLVVELERTDDILAGLARRRSRGQVLVGFAAETESDLDRVAPGKLSSKGCDLLVANDVLSPEAGFDVDTNRVTIYDSDGGREALELMSKRRVAARVLSRVVELLARVEGKARTKRRRAPRTRRVTTVRRKR
jgi:phosphopantothenoylcysteine decarboxylase/phosphopantothenate--cysteine ligase